MYSLRFLLGNLLQSITQSMVITIQWDTILEMAYILYGPYLLKQFHVHEEKKKKKHFVEKKEATRKDVERAFGVLQACFAIIRGATHFFKLETLKDIMMACIIWHNMIIEDERHLNGAKGIDYEQFHGTTHNPVSHDHTPEFT